MSRRTVAELQSRFAYVDLGDAVVTPRQEFAAQVYDLCLAFGRSEVDWREWARRRHYLGTDAHRAWRLLLVALRAHRVPHKRCAGDGSTRSLQLTHETWWWVLAELSWSCWECGEWFAFTQWHKAPRLPMGCMDVVCEACA